MTVSVIVPLYDRWDLTEKCLTALNADGCRHELILVDNGSTDATALAEVTVRNPRNRGFAKACNQGARCATGDILVFLNNDTEPQAGWLEHLIAALEVNGSKVAGPQLVYPDLTLQSCGVSVDFSREWGREALPIVEPPFGYCAAVSGACLAVKKQDFPGFDEGFYNGYEDIDLCLQLGGAIAVPESIVIHLESQSDRTERFRAVRENVARLRGKWEQ